ncbi:hypothetical protein ABB02_01496 [Clostridiaceae bacterium JG1575]|nr:hypothetical protein ABB02_01496 [Clostridiaceae bacterium JG1575]
MWQRLLLTVRENIPWLKLIQYALFSILLALATLLIDYRILPGFDYIPEIFTATLRLSKNILSTLAGALLTITTFGFSTIMTVLGIYLNNYTPRILTNFMQKKETMKVIGLFSGGFVYCITMLFFLRDQNELVEVIAGAVGVLYSLYAMMYFLWFVRVILTSIQPSNIIADITQRAQSAVGKAKEKYQAKPLDWAEATRDLPQFMIRAPKTGFFDHFDPKALVQALPEGSGFVDILFPMGDHLNESEVMAQVYAKETIPEDALEKAAGAFFIQKQKNADMDYHFAMVQLVEIALRAISPGINDPNTAIHCIHNLADVLGDIAKVDLQVPPTVTKDGWTLRYRDFDLEEELHRTFEQLIHYGKEDLSVMRAIFETLQIIFDEALPGNRPVIAAFEAIVYEAALSAHSGEYDRRKLRRMRLRWPNTDAKQKGETAPMLA